MTQNIPNNMFLPFAATMVDGIPNCLYGTISAAELDANLSTPNLPSVQKMPELINKAITKEQVNNLSICFSRSLSCFVPDIGIVKLGIVIPPHKKPRLIHDGSKITKDVTQPINKLCHVKATEPEIKYGSVLADHCQYLWSIAAYFSGIPIYLYDDGISGAFPQINFSPNIARANVSIHQTLMILAIAMHFGGNFGPSGWEPTSEARSFLVIWLFMNCLHILSMNMESLTLISWLGTLKQRMKRDGCRIPPPINEFTKNVMQPSSFLSFYQMFVDDRLTAAPRLGYIKNLVAASI